MLTAIRYAVGPLVDEQGPTGNGYVFGPMNQILFHRSEPVRLEVQGWSAQPRPGFLTVRVVRHDGALVIENYISRLLVTELSDIRLEIEPCTREQASL
jgi:hypothetical protein